MPTLMFSTSLFTSTRVVGSIQVAQQETGINVVQALELESESPELPKTNCSHIL